jgi:hypothetical protein
MKNLFCGLDVAFGGGSSYWFADQLGTIFSFFIFILVVCILDVSTGS